MYTDCLENQNKVKALFQSCKTLEEKYQKIIEIGKVSQSLDSADKTPENQVQGCQSTLYLKTTFENERIFFETDSDALISRGLAVILTMVYSGVSPEAVLKCPPTYIEELEIAQSLTPTRANGLASILLRMKQEALKCFMLASQGDA